MQLTNKILLKEYKDHAFCIFFLFQHYKLLCDSLMPLYTLPHHNRGCYEVLNTALLRAESNKLHIGMFS